MAGQNIQTSLSNQEQLSSGVGGTMGFTFSSGKNDVSFAKKWYENVAVLGAIGAVGVIGLFVWLKVR